MLCLDLVMLPTYNLMLFKKELYVEMLMMFNVLKCPNKLGIDNDIIIIYSFVSSFKVTVCSN